MLSRVRPALALLVIALIVSTTPTLLTLVFSYEAEGGMFMVTKIASVVGSAIALVVASFITSLAANAMPG